MGVSKKTLKKQNIAVKNYRVEIITKSKLDNKNEEDSDHKGVCHTDTNTFDNTNAKTHSSAQLPCAIENATLSVKDQKARNKSVHEKTQRNITIMMFAVSVGLGFCFLPLIVWNIIIAVKPDLGEMEQKPGIQFVIRSPTLNSVINPAIFCIFNPQYRKYIKELFTRIHKQLRRYRRK